MLSKSSPSAAIFSPQNNPPKPSYLAHVRLHLLEEPLLKPILDAVVSLPETWNILASSRHDISNLKDGRGRIQSFPVWIKTGESDLLVSDMSGIVTLPLLIVIQIVQYFEYLKLAGSSHSQFMKGLQDGGVQGFCIGLLSATIVASSRDEIELARHAAVGIRTALAIGAFGDLGETSSNPGPTTMVVRLRSQDEGDKMVERFPGAYISGISDSKTISIAAPADQIADLKEYTDKQGLYSKMIHIRSKLHNPDNAMLVKECSELSSTLDTLPFPDTELLQVTVRSNRTGESLAETAQPLRNEVISTILASRCDWSQVIRNLGVDLQRTGQRSHTFAFFGIGNTVPQALSRNHELEITKLDMSLVTHLASPNTVPDTAKSFPTDAIAIVGAACHLPGADSLDQLWDIVSHGRSRLEKLRADRVNLKESYRASQDKEWASKRDFFGNFIDDVEAFDHAFFGMSPREAKYMDPQQRLLLSTAFEAMDSSGYMRHHRRDRGDAVGCFIGASYTEYLENTSAYNPSAFTATGTIRAFLSGKISYHFGWTGPSEVIDTACSASIVAVNRACQAIHSGECSMALAGGVNVITGINNYLDLAKANFLSPTGQCKPFDDSGDGYCRADGVGLVVLKPLGKAIDDGDCIMGVIPAIATNQGGLRSTGITVPDGTAQKALYRGILRKAGVRANVVSYVETHGTGTQAGDPIEIDSVREVFGGPKRADSLYIGSLKANIGHSETAAGVASLVKVLTMLQHRRIPPLQGFKRLNRKIPPLEPDNISIPMKLTPWNAGRRVALINSYGASGSNSALLCSEWLEGNDSSSKNLTSASTSTHPILLSAASAESLQRYATDLASYITKSVSDLTVSNLAFTLSERRKHHPVRWAITASDLSSVVDQLRKKSLDDFFQTSKTPKKIVLVLSGQSRTNIALDSSIWQANPRFQEYIKTCNDILQSFGCPDILTALDEDGPISDPVMLQCGTVVVQYACAKCWLDGGLKVDAVIGHSLGELAALAVSGVLSLADALKVVYTRAELMKEKWGPERGTMLAIHAELDTVQSVMEVVNANTSHKDEALEIACYNSRTSHVVVGKDASITMAEEIILQDSRYQGLRYQRLNVSHGFHSRFTEPLLEDLILLAKTLKFKEPTIPLETSSGNSLRSDEERSNYLAKHARDPVYFVDAVRRLEERQGPCVWLEAGLNTPIIAMTKKAVAQPQVHTFQAVTSPVTATTSLWREGIANTLWSFLTPKSMNLKPIWLPPYNFDRPKHWLDHVDRAVEEQRTSRSLQSSTTGVAGQNKAQLVSYKGPVGSEGLSHQFRLHTTTERYTKIVKGHAVRQKPLCPASMYMEAAVMGAENIGFELRRKTITFQNVVFHRPLGCGDGLNVQLYLNRNTGADSWHYVVQSSPKSTHSEGDLIRSTTASSDMQLYEQLVSEAMIALRNNADSERLMRKTAYSLFSNVVEYSDVLRGISSILLGTKQALAEIKVPNSTFTNSESTVTEFFDAVTLDTFIQVLGLLINCRNDSSEEIYIASCIDKMVILPTEFHKTQTWTVYATYTAVDSKTSSGSVFAFSENGKLAAYGTKIQFMKTEATKLERVLEAANPRTRESPAIPSASTTSRKLIPGESLVDNIDMLQAKHGIVTANIRQQEPEFNVNSKSLEDPSNKIDELKSLISSYTGIKVSDIHDDEGLGSMGIDSLASIELADEIESKLGIQVTTEDLLSGSVRSLSKLFHSTILKTPLECYETDSESTNTSAGCSSPSTKSSGTASLAGDSPVDSFPWKSSQSSRSRHKIETVIYKVVDGVDIPADIFIPMEVPTQKMPIALMIHGGGHLTLSRKAVRPSQTSFLLENGILPVSLDYRLCPHVNVLDGPMTDVRDACAWAQRDLPQLMASKGIDIDPAKFVVIGWSTGGTLAMTTSWTLPKIGLPPPLAVLSFYCPVEYNPEEPILMGRGYAPRTMSFSQIYNALPQGPTTTHAFNTFDTTKLGWIQPGDPRSELVLALVKEENGMSLLFNGLPPDGDELQRADAHRAASFSPLVQVRKGNYHTPTYLIIGDEDEIVPFGKAVEFGQAMEENGIKSGILLVKGAKHIFDLGVTPGSKQWDQGVGPGYDFLLRELENARRD